MRIFSNLPMTHRTTSRAGGATAQKLARRSTAHRCGWRFVVVMAVTLAVAVAIVSSASAESPWWQLSTGSRPTNLWVPKSEVQELRSDSAGVTFVSVEGKQVACMGGPTLGFFCALSGLPNDETVAQLQESLEGPYGAGNVEVTEDTAKAGHYLVRAVGANTGRYVASISASSLGGVEAASVKTITEGGSGQLVITLTNVGDAPVDGSETPVTITDALPQGVAAYRAEAVAGFRGTAGSSPCTVESPSSVSCSFEGTLAPYEAIEVEIYASLTGSPPAAGASGKVTVSGGTAASVSSPQTVAVSEAATPFGVESYSLQAEEDGGAPDLQAGSHPFQLTTVLQFNSGPLKLTEPGNRKSAVEEQPGLPRNLRFKLPAGLVGNATAIAQCTFRQFTVQKELVNECPAESAIGVASVTVVEPSVLGFVRVAVPLFNLEPVRGEPARFGFMVAGTPVLLDTSVRSGEEYGVTVSVTNTPELAQLLASTVTFWGVPGDRRHDQSRSWGCVYFAHPEGCSRPATLSEKAFLRLPTSCGDPLTFPMELEPWNAPLGSTVINMPFTSGALDGCNRVPFEPTTSVAPDVPDASTPTGLTVHVRVPNETVLTAAGISESDLRNTIVTLPRGVTLNPGGAGGLEACSEAQIGYRGTSASGMGQFTPDAPNCPESAKIATVKITTPLLPSSQPLEGVVYLASPAPNGEMGMNPFNSLVAMYIVAEDPVSGTLVKLPGKVVPDPVTGQLTSTFEDTPQLPFEDLELHFFGGSRAPLATPALCGDYTTTAQFTPWSGNPPVSASSTFQITSGPNGSPCSDPQPFAPEFQAGTTNIQAGAFTELRTTMGHPDADQTLGGLSITMPPGLSGTLSSVKLCPEPQASRGECGPESLIGHTVVTAGLGSSPVVVKRPGSVYITGPYKGAPFGLSIVNPAEAGPFNLGNVIVRAKIDVDPHTAQLSIVSDPLPTIKDGIPLDIQHVAVTIDRPDFTFNPTNCAKMAITGSISSSQGTLAPASSSFQATNCAALAFAPKFKVSTSGKTSKANGASLSVKLTYPNTPQGTEANIARVKVDLPKQLPSRLTTLQKACLAATFEANPANCPSASVVGHAKAITPILPVPLEGPAYFVSHGGEAFPSLIVVLQGYGVTVDLVGTTFISKAGITSSTFKTVPDVPVGSFELNLPEGKFSALAANGNLCTSKLAMPTEFLAQNGAKINESTPIAITGCAKAKPPTRAQKLAKALKACKQRAKAQRAVCQRQARKQYAPVKKKAKSKSEKK
jgi:hypothetical protein